MRIDVGRIRKDIIPNLSFIFLYENIVYNIFLSNFVLKTDNYVVMMIRIWRFFVKVVVEKN